MSAPWPNMLPGWILSRGPARPMKNWRYAALRKLLHAIHGMLKHDKPFDNTRFYAIRHLSDN
jgi:hypothetical protein